MPSQQGQIRLRRKSISLSVRNSCHINLFTSAGCVTFYIMQPRHRSETNCSLFSKIPSYTRPSILILWRTDICKFCNVYCLWHCSTLLDNIIWCYFILTSVDLVCASWSYCLTGREGGNALRIIKSSVLVHTFTASSLPCQTQEFVILKFCNYQS